MDVMTVRQKVLFNNCKKINVLHLDYTPMTNNRKKQNPCQQNPDVSDLCIQEGLRYRTAVRTEICTDNKLIINWCSYKKVQKTNLKYRLPNLLQKKHCYGDFNHIFEAFRGFKNKHGTRPESLWKNNNTHDPHRTPPQRGSPICTRNQKWTHLSSWIFYQVSSKQHTHIKPHLKLDVFFRYTVMLFIWDAIFSATADFYWNFKEKSFTSIQVPRLSLLSIRRNNQS